MPDMSVHGDTDVPPPQTPPPHVWPVVHGLPSSQPLPSDSGLQIAGSPLQVQHGSTWHSASQPSPLAVLPSSQVQRVATTPPTKTPAPPGSKKVARPSSMFSLGMMRPTIPARPMPSLTA